MTPKTATEEQWLTWFDVQKAATTEWLEGDLQRAIEMLDSFLSAHPATPIQRQATGFRGSLHEEAGDLEAAMSDFMTAWKLSDVQDFERYTLEESIAVNKDRLGDEPEAERWCLRALATAAADPKTSGAGSLLRLLRLRGKQELSEEEHRLVKKVVHQAWQLLRVPGEPDLTDLAAVGRVLQEAQRGPFSAERPPQPQAYEDPADEE